MTTDLKGKTAVVTGGSRGIGAAITRQFAAMGADVAILYAGNQQAAEAICEACQTEYGVRAKAYRCDVSNFEDTKKTMTEIKKDFADVHILVNNAGITKDALTPMMKEEDFDAVLDTNLKGAFNMIRHTCGVFIRKKEAGQLRRGESGTDRSDQDRREGAGAEGCALQRDRAGFYRHGYDRKARREQAACLRSAGTHGATGGNRAGSSLSGDSLLCYRRSSACRRRPRHVEEKGSKRMENRRVVVTGMGTISPIGHHARAAWESMKAGKNGIGPITLFDTTNYKTKLAAEVKDFDPREYLEVNDVLRTDRSVQFAAAAAQQAAEESGIVGTIDPERCAVLFGSGIGGIRTFEAEYSKLLEKGPRRVSPLFIPMLISNMASGMIAMRHDCRGTAMPAVTACASGSNAIGEAMRLIRHGYADAVITGGTEAAICPSAAAGFVNMQALSTAEDSNAASLPFDRRRGGFVMGEGAAALVLEEYMHAKARGAKIYGEVCGYGSTCDAYHMTAPHPQARGGARAMQDAMKEAAYSEKDVVYINAHGTGTPMNDKVETLAIKKAYVSSTKSMTGHMLGAAGAIEAIACLMALQEKILPPTINLQEQDEACDLFCVPNQAIAADITLAISNSLGFGGHNASLAFRRI